MMNLYDVDLSASPWQKCGGNSDSNNDSEACALLADLPGGGLAIRDSKNPAAGELRFDATELDYLAGRIRQRSGAM